MRDKNRILKLLKEVERIWSSYQDLRFMQLIDTLKTQYAKENNNNPNIFHFNEKEADLFYVEDEDFLKWLKEYKSEKGE